MDPFIGSVCIFGGNFAPRAWAFCDGQLLAISSNTALFSILGTTYGGDGRTTFALPDLRGRVPVGPRNGPGLSDYRLGERGGQEDVVLNTTQIPSHTHSAAGTVQVNFNPGTPANSGSPSGKSFAFGTVNVYNSEATNAGMAANNVKVDTGNTGGGQDHENRQPFLAINYIIALFGIYPSRS